MNAKPLTVAAILIAISCTQQFEFDPVATEPSTGGSESSGGSPPVQSEGGDGAGGGEATGGLPPVTDMDGGVGGTGEGGSENGGGGTAGGATDPGGSGGSANGGEGGGGDGGGQGGIPCAANCPASLCDTTTGVCGACSIDPLGVDNCASLAATPHCADDPAEPNLGSCVECTDDAQCLDPALTDCDEDGTQLCQVDS